MLINKLEDAESIVSNFNDLNWDGWDIVSREKSHAGYSSKHGIFLNNQWHIQKRFNLTKDGWHIPNKYSKGVNND